MRKLYIPLMHTFPDPTAHSSHALPIRKLHVDLSQGFERHWFKTARGQGDAFRTAYFNAMSMTFPAGEQLFIDSVKRVQNRLPQGDAMHETIRDFCAQEATHRHVHAQYNEHINPMHHLGVTAANEHYTAVMSDALLRHDALTAGMTAQMRQVWRWHAMEETEHKAVAFDLYAALGGSHAWRMRYFVYGTVMLISDVMRQTVSNLWQDGTLFKPSTLASAAPFFFGKPSKGGGWIWLTTRPMLAYLRKYFHPNQHNNRDLALSYANSHTNDWRLIR